MDWNARVRRALSARTPDADVVEELAQHAQAMYDAARADGCSQDEAERRVDGLLLHWQSDADALRHWTRRAPMVEPPPAASPSPIAGLGQDIRYAARLLRRQPRFALLVVLTMMLAICAATVLFSVTYGVLMKPLPWPNGDRLVQLKETRGGAAPRFGAMTNAAYLAWRAEAQTIDGLAAWSIGSRTLTGHGDPERTRVTMATASLFSVLGVHPRVGAVFDEGLEGTDVVVLSERLWTQRFGADPGVPGRVLHLDGRAHTIVGVLPDDFAFPDRQTQAWVPFRVPPATGNMLSMFNAVALLRPGVTAAQASAEGTGRGRFAADTGLTTTAVFGSTGPIEIAATPLRDALTADVRRPILMLLMAVLLLVVTATANVAGLQLARATTRRREIAIRAALGAGTMRVTRQLLVESVMLALIGGAAGLLAAALVHRAMPSVLPADFPRADALGIDWLVLSFALLVSTVTGIAFGVLPALRAGRLNLVANLAEEGGTAVGASRRSRTARVRMVIMAGQVAIACVLLLGASLLGRSFLELLRADRGYDPSGILTARLSLSAGALTPEQRFAAVEAILGRLATMPGVTAAAFTSEMPLTPGGSTTGFTMPSARGDGSMISAQASPRIVSPRIFPALGMRIVAGRGFADSDTETSPPVVVVNRAFSAKYLGETPIGKRLPVAGYDTGERAPVYSTVIGVLDDVRYVAARESSQPEMFYSHRQMRGQLPVGTVTLLVRTAGDPRALAPVVRSVVRAADDRLVPESIVTMEERLLTTLARPRLYAILLGAFASFSLAIAAVGLFAVLSYSVAQRSRELAMRAALGARRSDIVRIVLRQGLAVTVSGLCAGVLLSTLLTRGIGSLLYGISRHDAVTYAAVPIVLLAVATVACLVPAWRAARLDPLRVLKGE